MESAVTTAVDELAGLLSTVSQFRDDSNLENLLLPSFEEQPAVRAQAGESAEAVNQLLAPGNAILFMPAGTGMEEKLLNEACKALKEHANHKVLFVGDSMEFLVGLHERAKAVLQVSLGRCTTLGKAASMQDFVTAHGAMFVSYGVLLALLARKLVTVEEVALVVLDNAFEADEVMAALQASAVEDGTSPPRVLAWVPPLVYNNLTEVVDLSEELQRLSEVLSATVVEVPTSPLGGTSSNASPRMHASQITFQDLPGSHGFVDAQVGQWLSAHCTATWQLLLQLVGGRVSQQQVQGSEQLVASNHAAAQSLDARAVGHSAASVQRQGSGIRAGSNLRAQSQSPPLRMTTATADESSVFAALTDGKAASPSTRSPRAGAGQGAGSVSLEDLSAATAAAGEQLRGLGGSSGKGSALADMLLPEEEEDGESNPLFIDGRLDAMWELVQTSRTAGLTVPEGLQVDELLMHLRRCVRSFWLLQDVGLQASAAALRASLQQLLEKLPPQLRSTPALYKVCPSATAAHTVWLQTLRDTQLLHKAATDLQADVDSGQGCMANSVRMSGLLKLLASRAQQPWLVVVNRLTREWVAKELRASQAVQANWDVVVAPEAGRLDDTMFATQSKDSKPKVVLVAPQQLHYAHLLWKLPKFRAVRFSAANMSLVLAESRLLPANSCLELVVGVTRRQAEEMEGVLDLETRVKAAVQLVANGGHDLYHALCLLRDEPGQLPASVQAVAERALNIFCEHSYGQPPQYAVEEVAVSSAALIRQGSGCPPSKLLQFAPHKEVRPVHELLSPFQSLVVSNKEDQGAKTKGDGLPAVQSAQLPQQVAANEAQPATQTVACALAAVEPGEQQQQQQVEGPAAGPAAQADAVLPTVEEPAVQGPITDAAALAGSAPFSTCAVQASSSGQGSTGSSTADAGSKPKPKSWSAVVAQGLPAAPQKASAGASETATSSPLTNSAAAASAGTETAADTGGANSSRLSADEPGREGGKASTQYRCTVALPRPLSETGPLLPSNGVMLQRVGSLGGPASGTYFSGLYDSPEVARQMAACVACKALYHQGDLATYFGLTSYQSASDDEVESLAGLTSAASFNANGSSELEMNPLPPRLSFKGSEAGSMGVLSLQNRFSFKGTPFNSFSAVPEEAPGSGSPAAAAASPMPLANSLRRMSSVLSRRSSITLGGILSRNDSLLYTPYYLMAESVLREDSTDAAALARMQSFKQPPPRRMLECHICGVRASNQWNFKSHLLGRKHTKRVAAMGGGIAAQSATAAAVADLMHEAEEQNAKRLEESHPGDPGAMGEPLDLPTRVIDSDGAPLITVESGQRTIFMCRVCNVSATSARNYLAHIKQSEKCMSQGKSHLKKLKKASGKGGDEVDSGAATPVPAMEAAFSQGVVSTTSGESRPVEGKGDVNKHVNAVAKVLEELGQELPDVPEMPYKCELCGIYTTSQQLMDGHMTGRKHLKRVQQELQSKMGRNDVDQEALAIIQARLDQPKPQPQTPYHCSVCDVYATSEQQLEMHYKGRKHQLAAQAQRLEKGAGASPLGKQRHLHPRPHSASPVPRGPDVPPGVPLAFGPGGPRAPFAGSRGNGYAPAAQPVRQPSGNVYDNFPCVRVGDVMLPSSMDLRTYLDEVQLLRRDASLTEQQAVAAAAMGLEAKLEQEITAAKQAAAAQQALLQQAAGAQQLPPTAPRHTGPNYQNTPNRRTGALGAGPRGPSRDSIRSSERSSSPADKALHSNQAPAGPSRLAPDGTSRGPSRGSKGRRAPQQQGDLSNLEALQAAEAKTTWEQQAQLLAAMGGTAYDLNQLATAPVFDGNMAGPAGMAMATMAYNPYAALAAGGYFPQGLTAGLNPSAAYIPHMWPYMMQPGVAGMPGMPTMVPGMNAPGTPGMPFGGVALPGAAHLAPVGLPQPPPDPAGPGNMPQF